MTREEELRTEYEKESKKVFACDRKLDFIKGELKGILAERQRANEIVQRLKKHIIHTEIEFNCDRTPEILQLNQIIKELKEDSKR